MSDDNLRILQQTRVPFGVKCSLFLAIHWIKGRAEEWKQFVQNRVIGIKKKLIPPIGIFVRERVIQEIKYENKCTSCNER